MIAFLGIPCARSNSVSGCPGLAAKVSEPPTLSRNTTVLICYSLENLEGGAGRPDRERHHRLVGRGGAVVEVVRRPVDGETGAGGDRDDLADALAQRLGGGHQPAL